MKSPEKPEVTEIKKVAWEMWSGGASNRRAVSLALTNAIDFQMKNQPSEVTSAIQLLVDHLAFLVGLPQPSLSLSNAQWALVESECYPNPLIAQWDTGRSYSEGRHRIVAQAVVTGVIFKDIDRHIAGYIAGNTPQNAKEVQRMVMRRYDEGDYTSFDTFKSCKLEWEE